ncbi:hypothetical protein HZS_5658, partial [Henneguya salminicola]
MSSSPIAILYLFHEFENVDKILCELLDNSDSKLETGKNNEFSWILDNKYYRAEIVLKIVRDSIELNDIRLDSSLSIESVIFLINGSLNLQQLFEDKNILNTLNSVETNIILDFDNNSKNLQFPLDHKFSEFCAKNDIEWISLYGIPEEFRSKDKISTSEYVGIDRAKEVVHLHPWPNIVKKDTIKQKLKSATATDEDDHLFDMELLCPICIDCFTEPIMLTCHHTFCTACIGLFFNYSKKHYRWKTVCPVCRSLTYVNCGISDEPTKILPRNYIVSGLVLKIKESCQESFNNNQANVIEHNDKLKDDKVFCKLHKKNLVKYYCKRCRSLICRVCTIMNHREHDLVFPHEVALSYQDDLESKFEDIQCMNKKLDISLNTLILTVTEIRLRYKEIIEQVDSVIELRTKIMIEKKKELIENLNKVVHRKIKKLMVQKDLLELEFGKCKITLNNAGSILKNGTAVEKLSLKTLIDEQIKSFSNLSLEPEEDDTIIYEIPEKAIEKFIESIGTIEAKSTFADISFAYGEALEFAKMNTETHFNVVACSKTGHPNINGDLISVSIKTPEGSIIEPFINNQENGEYIVTFKPEIKGKHKIDVNLRGRPIQKSPFICNVIGNRDYGEISHSKHIFGSYGSGMKEFRSPLGVTCDKNGFIYVSDCFNHRLQVFGANWEHIYTYGSQGCRKGYLNNPSGLASCQKTHRLFICDTGNARVQIINLNTFIQEDSTNPNVSMTKFGSEGSNPGYFKTPSGIAVSNITQEIAVCDPGNNCVQIYNPEGIFISRIGGQNTKNKINVDNRISFNSPSHAVYEPENGLLYISDTKNNRIVVYDRRFKHHVRKIDASTAFQVSNPKGLAFDQANNLIVINSGSNSIGVLGHDGVPIQNFGGTSNSGIKLASPESVCVQANGNLVITDCSNHRI